jgi:hypothetical protein
VQRRYFFGNAAFAVPKNKALCGIIGGLSLEMFCFVPELCDLPKKGNRNFTKQVSQMSQIAPFGRLTGLPENVIILH